MKDENYLILRKIFFWIFFISFIVIVPILVFYSLGYKFDVKSKKISRTGTISLKSSPEDAKIFLNGIKLNNTTPDVLSGLVPQDYAIRLEKDDFYPYQLHAKLMPSSVSEFNITLIPKIKYIEKLEPDFNIYKFFISKHFYGNKVIAFTDQGIYYLDDDFKNDKKISAQSINKDVASNIEEVLEGDDKLIAWSKNGIWIIDNGNITLIYKPEELIKNVFFGLKERYLLIQDWLNIVALDVENPSTYYPILKLKDKDANIFYDSGSEILYIRDKITGTETYSLYRSKLRHLIHERGTDQKAP